MEGPEADDVAGCERDDVDGADDPPVDVCRVGCEEEGDDPGQNEAGGDGGRERDVGEGQADPAAAGRREQQRHRRGVHLCRDAPRQPLAMADGPRLGGRGARHLDLFAQPRRLHEKKKENVSLYCSTRNRKLQSLAQQDVSIDCKV